MNSIKKKQWIGRWFMASCFIGGGLGAYFQLHHTDIAFFYWIIYLNFCALIWTMADFINKNAN